MAIRLRVCCGVHELADAGTGMDTDMMIPILQNLMSRCLHWICRVKCATSLEQCRPPKFTQVVYGLLVWRTSSLAASSICQSLTVSSFNYIA